MCYIKPCEIVKYLEDNGYYPYDDFWWGDFSKNELQQVAYLIVVDGKINLLTQKDSSGTTFFHSLFEDEENYSVAEYILENVDVDVNMQDEDGYTPLHYVAMNLDDSRNYEIAQLLIKKGANVNIQNNLGLIPLHYAIENYSYGEGSLLELLIRVSNLCIKDIYGKTVYDYIVDEAYYEIIIWFYKSVRLKIKLENILKHCPISKIEVEMYDLKEFFIKICNSKGDVVYDILLEYTYENRFIRFLEKNLHKFDFKNDRFNGNYEDFEKFIKNKQ